MDIRDFLHIEEIKALFDCPENKVYHPEGNTGEHIVNALNWLKRNCPSELYDQCFLAVLLHDIGKPKTDPDKFPKHPKHDEIGAKEILWNVNLRKEISNVIGKDIDWIFIKNVCFYHMSFWHFKDRNMKTQSFLKIFEDVGEKDFESFLWSVFADNCSNDDPNDKSYMFLFNRIKRLHKDVLETCDQIKPNLNYKKWENIYWNNKIQACKPVVTDFIKDAQMIVFDDIVESFRNMLKDKYNAKDCTVSINKENTILAFTVNNFNFLIDKDVLFKCNGRVMSEDLFNFTFNEDLNIWFVNKKC